MTSTAVSRPVWLVGPRVDLLCVVLSPVLTLIAVVLFVGVVESFGSATTVDAARARLFLFGQVWTGAHLVAVFLRSHADPAVFARHRFRFVVVPPLLYLVVVSSPWTVTTAFAVAVLWDVWHTAMQNFGLGRLYEARAGNRTDEGRGMDLAVNVAVYVAPILAGLSFVPTFDWLAMYSELGWGAPERWLSALAAARVPIRVIAIGGGSIVVLLYLVRLRSRRRAGGRAAPIKLLLLASTAAGSIVAWGFLPPFEAFVTVNLWHALQYFVIVWATEKEQVGAVTGLRRFGLPPGALLLAYGLLLACVGLAHTLAAGSSLRVFVAAALVCSLLHFWYDGFVWSVRRRHV